MRSPFGPQAQVRLRKLLLSQMSRAVRQSQVSHQAGRCTIAGTRHHQPGRSGLNKTNPTAISCSGNDAPRACSIRTEAGYEFDMETQIVTVNTIALARCARTRLYLRRRNARRAARLLGARTKPDSPARRRPRRPHLHRIEHGHGTRLMKIDSDVAAAVNAPISRSGMKFSRKFRGERPTAPCAPCIRSDVAGRPDMLVIPRGRQSEAISYTWFQTP